MDDNSCVRWYEQCVVEAKFSIKDIIFNEFGINTGESKKIKSKFSLLK